MSAKRFTEEMCMNGPRVAAIAIEAMREPVDVLVGLHLSEQAGLFVMPPSVGPEGKAISAIAKAAADFRKVVLEQKHLLLDALTPTIASEEDAFALIAKAGRTQ
jgi:hypothetical protein